MVELFAQEVLRGMALGLMIGWLAWTMCRTIDGHVVEVITLAMVGGYTAAVAIGVSGPLAMVIAGW